MNIIYIWGTGRYSGLVYEIIDKNVAYIAGFIDNNNKKQGSFWNEKVLISSPEVLCEKEFDYIFLSMRDYNGVLNQCISIGIPEYKIIVFWKLEKSMPCIDTIAQSMQICYQEELNRYKWRLENQPYELGLKKNPIIKSSKELLKKIIKEGSSLCRFGDGEFELIRGNNRPWFQKVNKNLAFRLKEVLNSRDNNIIIAVANNFGNLDYYTENAADNIRNYLCDGTRERILEMLDMEYTYYDAYVSRPYIIYKNKNHAKEIFRLFKTIWKERNVLIVEGKHCRNGIGNDLFYSANNIRRILCPAQNAFEYYDEILDCVNKNVSKDEIVIISLGPTATVLAYDLAKNGVQSLDIGQLDIEYEWFLQNAINRINIQGKGVAELDDFHYPINVVKDYYYEKQILARITK